MNSDERETLARRVLALSTAPLTEVLVTHVDAALSRFTRETLHQNVDRRESAVSVRTVIDGRMGVARTNRSDDASLHDVVERARALAAFAPHDEFIDALPLTETVSRQDHAFSPATADATASRRAQMIGALFDRAAAVDAWCAGFVATERNGLTIVNSHMDARSFDVTEASLNVKMIRQDSTGFAEAYATDIDAIDAPALGAHAADIARQSAHPRSVEPGAWSVIFEPAAMGEMFAYLGEHFSAQAMDEGSACFGHALDEAFFAPSFSLHDDWSHPLAPGMPFDFEGAPKHRLPLIEGGVIRNIVTDSYYARKLARANTGHALPAPNALGPRPVNLVVVNGTATREELIARTARGLLVTRLWYIRVVDRKRIILTGMTRDGTFLIEDGQIVGGARNLRFNESLVDALRGCEFANNGRRTGGNDYSVVTPSARIEGFSFTSSTEF